MPYKDEEKRRAARRRHYEKNREREIARAVRNAGTARAKISAVVREAKSVPCTDCKNSYPYYVMEFDHCKGEKLGDIGTMASQRASIVKIRTEIEKCEVVCANCHRERTFRRTLPY